MYTEVVVIAGDSLKSYTVTDNDCYFNGYVTPGVCFHTKDEDGLYQPVKNREEYVIVKGTVKPSIYKRRYICGKRDEYKYAFSEKTTKTTVTNKDVYYNEKRDKFLSKGRVSTNTRTEYTLPRLIVF